MNTRPPTIRVGRVAFTNLPSRNITCDSILNRRFMCLPTTRDTRARAPLTCTALPPLHRLHGQVNSSTQGDTVQRTSELKIFSQKIHFRSNTPARLQTQRRVVLAEQLLSQLNPSRWPRRDTTRWQRSMRRLPQSSRTMVDRRRVGTACKHTVRCRAVCQVSGTLLKQVLFSMVHTTCSVLILQAPIILPHNYKHFCILSKQTATE